MSGESNIFSFQRFKSSIWIRIALIAVIFTLTPMIFGPFLASDIIILAIIGIGYNLLLGYGGELSFGHAALYGGGAYLTILFESLVQNLYAAIVLSVITVTLVSIVFGIISLQRRGLYFAMITLALAQLVYSAVIQSTDITGGTNGLSLTVSAGRAAIGPLHPLQSKWDFYIIALVLLIAVYLAVYRVTRSPFGRALIAIRESEERARHLGYPINRLLLISFTMSGFLAGLAGAMYTVLYSFVGPSILSWSFSGEIVLLTIIGGIGTLGGPVVGAFAYGILSEELTAYTNHWPIIFGGIFVILVMFAPQGIYGLYLQIMDEDEDPKQDILEILSRIWNG